MCILSAPNLHKHLPYGIAVQRLPSRAGVLADSTSADVLAHAVLTQTTNAPAH